MDDKTFRGKQTLTELHYERNKQNASQDQSPLPWPTMLLTKRETHTQEDKGFQGMHRGEGAAVTSSDFACLLVNDKGPDITISK